ncbi:hypothetical protein QBC32DRAFT_90640 [Pseudoneurospora amorphoporcata]|uniref:Uncharacterized protein n=1 Tax=Pseudoneurospora amorphoporcata TaxID=241081 RepID=A0AAN6SI03_9PEZI|nr:hypothetical protein QBC32DRAFT_90640 [Pseudoneurospora amorphoporcata]
MRPRMLAHGIYLEHYLRRVVGVADCASVKWFDSCTRLSVTHVTESLDEVEADGCTWPAPTTEASPRPTRRITCDRLLLFVLRHLYQLLPLFMARTVLRFMAAMQLDSQSILLRCCLTGDLTNGMPSISDFRGAEVGDLGLSTG